MSRTTSEFELGHAATQSASRPQEFACAGEDLKDSLQALTRQISAADHRNTQVLEDMRGRLELLGRDVGVAREQARPECGHAFARIEDGVHQLADRIATVSRERDLKRPEPVFASLAEPHPEQAPWPYSIAAAVAAEPVKKTEPFAFAYEAPAVHAVAPSAPHVTIATPSLSVPGDISDPWDRDGADALARLYESGQAALGGHAHTASDVHISAPVPAAIEIISEHRTSHVASEPTRIAAPADTAHDADRGWLESRFAAIASRIEQSLGEHRPDNAFVAFDHRLQQLEARFGSAMDVVATRADVEGLRIIEAHVNELAAQFEHAHVQLGRLDSVEQHLGDLLHQVSDQRFANLFAQHATSSPPGSSEEDIEAVAMAVADRVASRLPQHLDAMPAAAGAEAVVADLHRLIEGFVAGQRDNEEHTSSMLDTMQQAMIRMLDRMDALENAAPAYPASQASFAAASQMTPAPQPYRPEPAFAEHAGRAAHAEAMLAVPAAAEPAMPVPGPIAGAAKEDFRAAAIADARRAARKVASQPEEVAAAQQLDTGRVRRGVPNVKASSAELAVGSKMSADKAGAGASSADKPRSRTPLMVAGVALVAAIGLLAASVGLNRGFTFMAGGSAPQQIAKPKAALTTDNGGQETSEHETTAAETATPPLTPNANPQRPAQAAAPQTPGAPAARPRSIPETALEDPSDKRDVATEAALVQQEAAVRAPAAAITKLPIGMTMTQARAVPNESDLARMRQQRNMQSLASQLAAVQANAPTVPASLLHNAAANAEPDLSVTNEPGKPSDMPPASIGPNSLRVAAAKGDPSAEFEVAARFAEGRGIAQDFKQAIVWYQRSAQRGFAPAQYRLGTLFERGIGTKADTARAKIWYGRAAEQGHVKAMHNLAVLSAGREQSADYPTAVTWFTAASEYGLTDSQYNLGVLHESGLGLPRDLKQAYYWLSLAARNGDKEASRRRDQVRMKLEEADVTATEKAVAVWQAKPSDSAVNDARVAGEGWKARQSASR